MNELTDEYLSLYEKYSINPNQAWICLQYAAFYCTDVIKKQEIKDRMDCLSKTNQIQVQKTAIVIISYNSKEIMIQCIESIRKHNPSDVYEIIVVDNHSEDGIDDWLMQQKDIKLICNKQNMGFTTACNQGMNIASPNADIFLLNNDTVLFKNSLFFLRLGLYESEHTGAVGSVSNNIVGYQQIAEIYQTFEAYEQYALQHNVYIKKPYERKCWLVGYAMLIKREALNQTGNLDERFSPGNFEDNDISIRLLQKGYHLLLCKNSFIYHYGSLSFKKDNQAFQKLLCLNQQKFVNKYRGIDYVSYSRRNTDLLAGIKENEESAFRLLEIHCGLGADLAYLESIYPNTILKGIEENKEVATLAKQVADVEWNTLENYESQAFDYLLINLSEDELTNQLDKIRKLLKTGGKLILGVDNRLLFTKLQKNKAFISVFHNEGQCVEFLNNNFTANNILQVLLSHQFTVSDMNFKRDITVQPDQKIKQYLSSIWQDYNETYFQTQKYILTAIKN